jgi:hypothetical protein
MDLYDGYTQTAMKYCDGDTQKADYFLDTSFYQYFYRLKQSKEFNEWKVEQMKPKT